MRRWARAAAAAEAGNAQSVTQQVEGDEDGVVRDPKPLTHLTTGMLIRKRGRTADPVKNFE